MGDFDGEGMDLEKQHVVAVDVVDREDDDDGDRCFSDSIIKRLQVLPGDPMGKERFTIFRVPANVRQANAILYEPSMISIGPYHRGAKGLRAMEDHKWRYLRDYLSRNPSKDARLYAEKMKECEAEARRCYAESTDLTGDEFAEMLLLDGCFILEFLIKWDNDQDDGLRDVGWNLPLIRSDLLLMENQIPFFVLQTLFDLQADTSGSDPGDESDETETLTSLVVEYLTRAKLGNRRPTDGMAGRIDHLLHLYHACLAPSRGILHISRRSSSSHRDARISLRPASLAPGSGISSSRAIPCATQLRRAGVVLKKKESSNFLDVTFSKGVLEIPYLAIEECTKSRFINAVVYEQCFPTEWRYLSGYAFFMDCIVNMTDDVAVLQGCGILDNNMANGEEAADFFNQLSKCCFIGKENHYLTNLLVDVVEYCNSNWHKHRAKLMRDYFSNPWAILSLGAALILLALTIVQTFFSAFSYFRPPTPP